MDNVVRLFGNSEVFAIELTDSRERSVAYFYISFHYRPSDMTLGRAYIDGREINVEAAKILGDTVGEMGDQTPWDGPTVTLEASLLTLPIEGSIPDSISEFEIEFRFAPDGDLVDAAVCGRKLGHETARILLDKTNGSVGPPPLEPLPGTDFRGPASALAGVFNLNQFRQKQVTKHRYPLEARMERFLGLRDCLPPAGATRSCRCKVIEGREAPAGAREGGFPLLGCLSGGGFFARTTQSTHRKISGPSNHGLPPTSASLPIKCAGQSKLSSNRRATVLLARLSIGVQI